MERFAHGLKVLWRSERLLGRNELRLIVQKAQFNALAGLVALFGLVMLSLAVFFALVPYWGQAWAAFAVAAADFMLAGVLFASARAVKPPAEVEMVQEMRDGALSDIEHEVSRADAELRALGNEARQFVRNPVDALLPAVLGPVLTAVTRSLKSKEQ